MNNWIFLSKQLQDQYVNQFAKGCGMSPVDTDSFVYEDSKNPIVLRGILKHKIMKKCWQDNRDFYYIDTGYFGNEITRSNPNGWKYWHRIVKNDLQHNELIQRPDDRFKSFGKEFQPWKKKGKKILIAAPDEKPCKFYNVDYETWVDNTIKEIKKYTDRPIEVRQRNKVRKDRIISDTLQQALDNDVFALVTFNSNAAVESIFHGIPVFVLAPTSAAKPVARTSLSEIENPYYADNEELYAWGCHLAYGQFHISEMKSGRAKHLLEKWYGN